ncbi:MAG: DUF362 domain-containing protein [Deltaproteobacteria bacterium]|nr:DUF362 domain-containing protein [Deltaproteobacteria bacterium]
MPQARVYFSDLRTSAKENLPSKLKRLMQEAGVEEVVAPRNLAALPFLTDANTLYAGSRGNSVDHLRTAVENGFAYSVVNAPLIIADGLRGASFSRVRIDQEIVKTAFIARDIVEADMLVSVAHFKGHELSGFGGTIKNLGMGCAARRGKLDQHSDLSPKVKRKKCVGCGDCVEHCAQQAISLKDEKAVIDQKRCVGCGECILICPNSAIDVQWNADIPLFQKKMAEYTLAVLKGKEGKAFFLNFLTDISPACDCYGHSDAPIVPDIGVVASTDPVAIDQASVDLVNQQAGTEQSCLTRCLTRCTDKGEDKFRGVYPKIDWTIQLDHAEEIGIGRRGYELVTV